MASFPIDVPVASSIPRLITDVRAMRSAVSGTIRELQQQGIRLSSNSAVLHRKAIARTTESLANIQLIRDAFRDASADIERQGIEGGARAPAIEARFLELGGPKEALAVIRVEQEQINTLKQRETELIQQTIALEFERTDIGRELILQEQVLRAEAADVLAERQAIAAVERERAEIIRSLGVPATQEEAVAVQLVSEALADVKNERRFINDLTDVEAELAKEVALVEKQRNQLIRERARLTGSTIAAIGMEATATGISNEQLKMSNELTRIAISSKRRLRAELIGASIGMFVFGITITQTISGLAGIIASGKEAAKTVTFLTNTVKAALGPIQVFMGILQFWNINNIQIGKSTIFLRTSLIGLIGTISLVVLLIAAFTTKSKTLRGVLAGLATTIGILTAAHIFLARKTILSTIATITKLMVESLGTLGLPIALALAGSAILAGIAVGVVTSQASFQTHPGEFKKVRRTGLAVVHEGETFSRPASIGDRGRISRMGGGMVINIFNRGDLDTNATRRLLRKFDSLQVGSLSAAGGS